MSAQSGACRYDWMIAIDLLLLPTVKRVLVHYRQYHHHHWEGVIIPLQVDVGMCCLPQETTIYTRVEYRIDPSLLKMERIGACILVGETRIEFRIS
jgi:hypothetical protein